MRHSLGPSACEHPPRLCSASHMHSGCLQAAVDALNRSMGGWDHHQQQHTLLDPSTVPWESGIFDRGKGTLDVEVTLFSYQYGKR